MTEDTETSLFPTDLQAWQALKLRYSRDMQDARLAGLFALDEQRFENFSLQACDLFLDYSKNLLDGSIRQQLIDLAAEAGLGEAIDAMFAGEAINNTEGRPVLHVALRAKPSDEIALNVPGVSEVWETLDAMTSFVERVQEGDIRGCTQRRLTEIVNIGIGGSDLGPVMASHALRHYWRPGMNFHSVSNVDGTQLVDLTEQLDPEETLFVICSKTFTTQETIVNARAASDWIRRCLGGDAIAHHFAAASTNHEAMDAFGINPAYRFGFWDWVGGRYSLWSAVGLSLALVIGIDNFWALLNGARKMDQHFRGAPFEANMPVLMALISVWYLNFFKAESEAILPYDNRLDRFPAYLQQLQMESNGKGVKIDGTPVAVETGSIIWGEPGSNAQHSFYQLLHQGTRFVPVDFILPVKTSGGHQEQQDLAAANCLAQSEALMDGHDDPDSPHRCHPGNRPSNTILMERLTPNTLGQLIALYEHKTFVEGVIWGINSFDQFGVELGKRLANSLAPAVMDEARYEGTNVSTAGLLAQIKKYP